MKKLFILMLLTINLAQADNGLFAINDVCDGFGCFPGDTGGLPVTITESGSYILTSNIVSASITTNVIEINADNVTLDLNGFSIIGPRTCTGDNATLVCTNGGMTAIGVYSNGHKNITVKNGMTKGFDTGVGLNNLNLRGGLVKNVTSSQNEFGISVINGVISDSIANRNLDTGFSNGLLGALMVKDSFAYGNKVRSVLAVVCSNVYLEKNGSDVCGRFTNDSTCNGGVACP